MVLARLPTLWVCGEGETMIIYGREVEQN